jgi:hypothetical protein
VSQIGRRAGYRRGRWGARWSPLIGAPGAHPAAPRELAPLSGAPLAPIPGARAHARPCPAARAAKPSTRGPHPAPSPLHPSPLLHPPAPSRPTHPSTTPPPHQIKEFLATGTVALHAGGEAGEKVAEAKAGASKRQEAAMAFM